MILVIDAYNLIKQISGLDLVPEQLRQKFIGRLVHYGRAKALKIYLVFDGGEHYEDFTQGPVIIFYAGPGGSADDLIGELLAELAQQGRQDQILLVTDDRALLAGAREFKVDSLAVRIFYNYLRNFEAESKLNGANNSSTGQLKNNKTQSSNRVREQHDLGDYQIYGDNYSLELAELMLHGTSDLSELARKQALSESDPVTKRPVKQLGRSKQIRQISKKLRKL